MQAIWTSWLTRNRATLFDLGELQVALEDLLGVRVDLITPGDLPQRVRERVLHDAVPQ